MSRINTNVSALIAQRNLNSQQQSLQTSLERLSTGLQINRGADNPAGLIASEKLQSEQAALTAAIGNAQRADQVVNIADGGLGEVNSLLLQVQSLVGQSANQSGISTSEKQANQLQIDSILQTIDRIASTTSFQGTQLLNGTYDFNVTNQAATVADYQINAAKLSHGGTQNVQVIVTASAHHGGLFLSAGANALALNAASGSFVFELAGAVGSRQFTYANGSKLSAIAYDVNQSKSVTGVSAVASGNYLELKSTDFGSSNFVSFKLDNQGGQAGAVFNVSSTNENKQSTATAQTFTTIANKNAITGAGVDVGAIVNGVAATSVGNIASINTDFLNLSLNLTAAGAQTLATINAFTINSGGANFNLGPNVNITNQVSIGIKNVATRNLGSVTTGYLSSLSQGQANNMVSGNLTNAQSIVNAAIDQISSLRGRLGAFQKNVIGATIDTLNVGLENTTSAESSIRDTDFAAQTAQLTRSQILVGAATSVLATANASPQSVLKLLG